MAAPIQLLGGIGVIHHNQSAESQAAMVRAVKRHENGFISNPVVLGPNDTAQDVLDVKERYGFCGIPITGKSAVSICIYLCDEWNHINLRSAEKHALAGRVICGGLPPV